MRRAKGAELGPVGYALASDYKKDDGDSRALALDDSLFPLIGVKNRTAVMGGIIALMLVLLCFSYTNLTPGAAEEWKPQSQLQMSHRQADLYEDLAFDNRARARARALPPGAPADGTDDEYAMMPEGNVQNAARDSDGVDERAFITMARQQETEMAKELGLSQLGAGKVAAEFDADRDDNGEEEDEDEDDEKGEQSAAAKAPGWRDGPSRPEMVPRPASRGDADMGDDDEMLPGDGDNNEMDDDAVFSDHVDDEPAPDDETTNEMADSMFDEMDTAPRNGIVTFSEWWSLISRDEPDAKMATEREHFQNVDKDGDGEVSRAELRRDWMRDDLLFLDPSDPNLQPDDDDDEEDADEDADQMDGLDEQDEDEDGDEDEDEDEDERGGAQEDDLDLEPEADDERLDERLGEQGLEDGAPAGRGRGQDADSTHVHVDSGHHSSLFSFLFGSDGDAGEQALEGQGAGGQQPLTLGDTLKKAAVRPFKQRAPRPHSLNVKLLTSDSRVAWSQAEAQCKRDKKRICPDTALDKLRLCQDRDPHHRGRWVPTDEFLTWVELDTCSRATVPRDQRLLPLIACC